MKRILCFGDSNTWGYNPIKQSRYPSGIRWTTLLHQYGLNKKTQVIEEGLCGRTTVFNEENRITRAGSAVLPVLLESHAPLDLVVIMLGTNDCKKCFQTNQDTISQGIEVLLKQIRDFSNTVKILLVSPITLGDDVYLHDLAFDQHSIRLSYQLKKAYQNIAYKWDIDFLAASDFANAGDDDYEHLNEQGHRLLGNALAYKIQSILEDNKDVR